MKHPLSEHDYDDVEARAWQLDTGAIASFDRTGLITWSWFNSAPSHFCTEGAQQTFADFLDKGPLNGCNVQPNTHEAMRAHLLARTRGSSTFLTLAGDAVKRVWHWRVDGVLVSPREIAGPSYAGGGYFSGAEDYPPSLLVKPAAHKIEVNVSGDARVFDLVVARGEQRVIVLD